MGIGRGMVDKEKELEDALKEWKLELAAIISDARRKGGDQRN